MRSAPGCALSLAALAAALPGALGQRRRAQQRAQQPDREEEVETPEQAAARAQRENAEEDSFYKDLYAARDAPKGPRGAAEDEDEDVTVADADEGGQVSDTRQVRMWQLEMQHKEITETEVHPARVQYHIARQRLAQENTGSSWFWSNEKKQRVAQLESEARIAAERLRQAENNALAVYRELKPYYGVLSVQHFKDQRRQVWRSMGIAGDVAYNQMIWNTLFNSRAENLGELVATIVMNYVFGYLIGYVMAFIHFAFSAPWTIYEYCSGWGDLPAALISWVLGLLLFLMPMILLCLCCGVVWRMTAEQRMQAVQRQQQARRARIQQGAYHQY
eukprot:TRINITY_DN1107_c0_g1_i1.p1 TRINITY_DN1107_c0_g1~~TRINITY_DN1107_c0_g1_i1.p1  ORF type:complete len:366 (+),score=150.21 TRINITY_DN1107_c0_g1_i1:104-1099(+)